MDKKKDAKILIVKILMKYSHVLLQIADINEIYLCAKYICRLQKWPHYIHINHNLN